MTTPSQRVVAWIWDHRAACAVLCVAVTLLAGWQATRIGVNNGIEDWFLDDDPQRIAYRGFQQQFGSDDVILAAVEIEQGAASDSGLTLLRRAEERLSTIDGVAGVVSIRGLAAPGGAAPRPDIVRRLVDDGSISGRLVSRDGRVAVIAVRLADATDVDRLGGAVIEHIGTALAPLGVPWYVTGVGVVTDALNRATRSSAATLMGASGVLIVALLWLGFRRLVPVLVTLAVVTVSAVWLMGLYGFLGRDVNMFTLVMPTVLMVTGTAGCVHVLRHFARASPPPGGRRERVVHGVGYALPPCLLSAVTTAFGFLALATSELAAVRDLGLFMAAGVMLAFAVTIVGCTCALSWAGAEPVVREHGLAAAVSRSLGSLGVSSPIAVIGLAGALCVVAALGISRLVVDTWSIGFLFEDHPVRRDAAFIENRVGPWVSAEFVVAVRDRTRVPGVLAGIAEWQRTVRRIGAAGWSESVADRLRAAGVKPGSAPAAWPPADASPRQVLVNAAGDELRVTFGIALRSAAAIGADIDRILAAAPPMPGADVRAAGYLPLYVGMVERAVSTQIQTFSVAFAAVFVLLAAYLRSCRLLLAAIAANVAPVLATLGVMGLAGIRLDVATVTIAAVVLGLVVDDTVHFVCRLRREQAHGACPADAIRETLRTTGSSMVMTTIVLGAGFSVLAMAQIKSVIWFGLLLALAMVAAMIADLALLPALLVVLRRQRGPARSGSRLRAGRGIMSDADG